MAFQRSCGKAAACSSLLLLLACGCAQHYWAETTLHSDGSVERAILQPSLPGDDEAQGKWTERRRVRPLSGEAPWPRSWEQLADAAPDDGAYRIAARGTFPTVADLPRHVVIASGDGKYEVALVRHHERLDWGFAVEHLWKETLPDVVTLHDLRHAVQELADLAIADLAGLLQAGYQDEYDFTALLEYCRSDGKAWFAELADGLYETMAARLGEEALEERVVAISARYGLRLRREAGQPESAPDADTDAETEAIRRFLADKLRNLVRRRDQQPLDERPVVEILEWLMPATTDSGTPPPRLQTVATEYISRKYGSEEAYGKLLGDYATRIIGLHLLGTNQFRYALRMPGLIVATSGLLESDSRVTWEFSAAEAYPLGYVMSCRSIEPLPDVQERVLGRHVLSDRATLLRYVALLGADEALAQVVRHAAQQGSREPLDRYRQDVLRENPNGNPKLDELWQLLGLMPQ